MEGKDVVCLFVCGWGLSIGLNPGGLSVDAATPDDDVVECNHGGWGCSPSTKAALSDSGFLCSRFHYIRVQWGGGGVRRQLGCGTGTQKRERFNVNFHLSRWKEGYRMGASMPGCGF